MREQFPQFLSFIKEDS